MKKKSLIVLLSLALLLIAAGCSPEGSTAHTVDEFIETYDAADFIFNTVMADYRIGGTVVAPNTGETPNFSEEKITIYGEDGTTKDDTRIAKYKEGLTSIFTKGNTRLSVTDITSAEGSRICTRVSSSVRTEEVKNVKIVFKYIKQTSSDNGSTWNNAEGAVEKAGYLYCSGVETQDSNPSRAVSSGSKAYTYSDISLSVKNVTGDEIYDVSSSESAEFFDVEWKESYDSTTTTVGRANCGGTDMSSSDLEKIQKHID